MNQVDKILAALIEGMEQAVDSHGTPSAYFRKSELADDDGNLIEPHDFHYFDGELDLRALARRIAAATAS